VREFLMQRGIDVTALTMINGAGLSREARVSARLLVDILRNAARSPYAAEFIASLSLGGQDGTTRGRFDARPGDGVMHVKTGRIDDVSALAGFVHGTARTYALAILVNAKSAHAGPGDEIESAVLRWIRAQH
jgi:D-alanyl-D-alanine carboxypeptidase/D-alanyl-D-alanine-endopeptidase (penicillin-binding protein 4)